MVQTPLLVQLTRPIFENNFLKSEFNTDLHHQIFGIAMATPFAVTAANAFLYYHERDIIETYSRFLHLYKRFIDDMFVIWDGPRETLLEFLNAINTKDERNKITYEISDSKISFLDLLPFKDTSYATLQYSTFQKPLHKYLYIPYESFHPGQVSIKNVILNYLPNLSSIVSYKATYTLAHLCQ